MTVRADGTAGDSPAQAVAVAAGDAATATPNITISFRSILPPAVVLASASGMLAPAAPADGKTALSNSHGLPKAG